MTGAAAARWLALRILGIPGIRSSARPAVQKAEVPAFSWVAAGTD